MIAIGKPAPERRRPSIGGSAWGRWLGRLVGSDRMWICASSMFSRISNFAANLILARYGGPAVLGAYAVTQSSAVAVVSPVQWSLSTSATLEARAAPDERARRAVTAAHVYWALLIAGVSGVGFLILQHLANDGVPHGAAISVAGLIVVGSMLVIAVLQGALHGAGAYKPVAARLVGVSCLSLAIAVPSVVLFGLVGALAALAVHYVMFAGTLAHLARPSTREPERLREAIDVARSQLVRSVPNVTAMMIAVGCAWLTSIFVIKASHGVAGVGVFAVGQSWLTIELMAVSAWGGLTLRVLGAARARSPHDFRAAIRRVLVKDVSFTMAFALAVFVCAEPLARLYGMEDTALPTLLRINSVTALVVATTQVLERTMFCLGQQRAWMRSRVSGNLCALVLAQWLVPIRLEYAAIALFCGYAGTGVACGWHFWRGKWLRGGTPGAVSG